MKKNWRLLTGIVGMVILIFGAVMLRLTKGSEYQAEMADLLGMKDAELAAMAAWRDKLPDKAVEYWFDANSFTLIPAEEPKPDPCGMGTEISGGAVKDFENKYGSSFAYSMNEDYRDQVIHLVVSGKEGKLQIGVDWVPALK